jgi:mono/diheme cytochrome c family protein
MRYILFLITPFFLFGSSTFITESEYASQLYKNPRGIACGRCHGDHGEGKLIARYKHKNKEKSFVGPPINNIRYSEFYRALNLRKKGMPRYYLTSKEIEALYFYLHKDDKKKVKNAQ